MLRELLYERKEAILQRWSQEALASYSPEAATLFDRQKDPFANPVGHSVREGTRGVFEALLDGMDPGRIRKQLARMVRIRAVQELTPTQALAFVFSLKEVVRSELGEEGGRPGLASELRELDSQIDGIALAAFEVFVECREELTELRINEVKRQVAWIYRKMNLGPPQERGEDLR